MDATAINIREHGSHQIHLKRVAQNRNIEADIGKKKNDQTRVESSALIATQEFWHKDHYRSSKGKEMDG